MGIFAWLIFGAIAGALARFFSSNDRPLGWVLTIVLGMAGSFVGNFILWVLTGSKEIGFSFWHFVVSVLGAMLVLWAVNKWAK